LIAEVALSIVFDNLRLRQGGFLLAADFKIETGRKIALIGPSGGGKSTFLAAIAGFQTAAAGRILHNGQDIGDLPPAKRPVTLLFQDHNLFPHLSVAQNVGLGCRADLRLSRQDQQAVTKALKNVGLDGQAQKRPAELSGGQQQRVALARALLRDKPVLLLDEPFAALGPALRHDMLDLVVRITDASGATLLMVTHQPQDARYLADQTIFVADGIAHAPIATDTLFANPPPALLAYLGDKQKGAL
jgi:thiamine transport system ATP-binding protein